MSPVSICPACPQPSASAPSMLLGTSVYIYDKDPHRVTHTHMCMHTRIFLDFVLKREYFFLKKNATQNNY